MCGTRTILAVSVMALGLAAAPAAGQALPPPDPTNITFTPSTYTRAGLVSTLSTPGTMSGTFAFPWGRVYRCGETKTLPATRHCADATFTAGGFSAEATGCYNQAVTDTYTSGPCQACQIYFVYYNAKLVLWQRTYTVAGFSYTTRWTSFHPGPNSGGLAHYGKLRISCITDNTCPGCGPGGAVCPPGGDGDCFVPNGTPGCADEGCCTNVCAMDPFCCDVMWEPPCADLALAVCIGDGQDVGPDVEATVALRIDLNGFFGDITGTPPAGHPILDPADSLAQLSEWHLCQIQQMVVQTIDGLQEISETPLSELVIVDADDTVHLFDLAADPDPFGLSPRDDFDSYAPSSDLHGQGGWKGWDDDPAFSAPVTNVQARSAPQSVDISGDADLVHELCTDGTGAWSYSAWQYIPLDMAVEGGGQFPGPAFVLLNSYLDGGPYHWSVQIRFDPNDGMAKALHGNGFDEIEVPYVTDRWAKIQVIVDEDDDWTRVYYDDQLVTEYPWTGGVLGNGGGALDIAAVDLYANQSTSVFYDDLRLEPISPTGGADLLLDGDGDGLSVLEEALRGTDPTNPDTDGDGTNDGADNCPLDANPDQRDVDGDGQGDVCDVCPGDLDGDDVVGVTDFLVLLGQWGTSPGGPPDFDGGGVGINDFLFLLSLWGPCS